MSPQDHISTKSVTYLAESPIHHIALGCIQTNWVRLTCRFKIVFASCRSWRECKAPLWLMDMVGGIEPSSCSLTRLCRIRLTTDIVPALHMKGDGNYDWETRERNTSRTSSKDRHHHKLTSTIYSDTSQTPTNYHASTSPEREPLGVRMRRAGEACRLLTVPGAGAC